MRGVALYKSEKLLFLKGSGFIINFFKLFRKNKGAALVYILVILVSITFLGVAVLSIATFSFNETYVKRNETQAYYTARSAIETTLEYLTFNMETQTIIPEVGASAITSDVAISSNNMGDYRVRIDRVDENTARITSTAIYNNQESTACVKITLAYGQNGYLNLERYAAYLKSAPTDSVADPVTVITTELNYANFINPPLEYVGNINNTLSNLTEENFDSLTETQPDPGWNNQGQSTIDLTDGGIYKYDGDISLQRNTDFLIGDQDAFLFVNGNFALSKLVDIKKEYLSSTGSFFIILCGEDRVFNVNQGAKGLNTNTDPEWRANLMVFAPDTMFERKNKFYFQGGLIVYGYNEKGSQATFTTPYLNSEGESPWIALFELFDGAGISIIPPNTASLNDIIWENSYVAVPFT